MHSHDAACVQVGLSTIAEKILGKPLDKSMQLSDWEQRPLSERQTRCKALMSSLLGIQHLKFSLSSIDKRRSKASHLACFVSGHASASKTFLALGLAFQIRETEVQEYSIRMPVEIPEFGFADAAMDALVMVQIWDMVKAEVGEGADQQLKLHCIDICRPSNRESSEGADAKRRALSVNTAKPCELWLFHSPNHLSCHRKESSPISQAP